MKKIHIFSNSLAVLFLFRLWNRIQFLKAPAPKAVVTKGKKGAQAAGEKPKGKPSPEQIKKAQEEAALARKKKAEELAKKNAEQEANGETPVVEVKPATKSEVKKENKKVIIIKKTELLRGPAHEWNLLLLLVAQSLIGIR